MSTAAQLQLVRDVLDSVAVLCEELAPNFPHLAAAAAHYFRHGAPGRVPALAEAQRNAFATAVETKLKHRNRGMGVLLQANIVDLLVEGEAFYVGDPLAPAPNDALAAVPLAAPTIPMSLLVSARRAAKRYNSGKVTQWSVRLRDRAWEIMTKAAVVSRMQGQLTEEQAANAFPAMQVPGVQLPAVYAAGAAMRYAERVACSPPVALWNFVITAVAVVDCAGEPTTGRIYMWPFAIVSVVFVHDNSTADLLFAREIPTRLQEWHNAPAPKEPLRIQQLAPMRVLGSAAVNAPARRVFAITNIPHKPVAVALAQHVDDDA